MGDRNHLYRLTGMVKAAGWASKLGPEVLAQATKALASVADPRLLVGIEWSDDAGVVRLDAERALVQTVDFFTPIVDDPYTFGAISATNALSDVYAMGGEPLSALNIVCFPDKELPAEVLAEILRGGSDKLLEAGAVLAGGHSVRDAEIKYGMAVTGLVHPDRIWRNGGALPGDVLVLTKPLGTGALTTAFKRDAIPEEALQQAVRFMSTLNKEAMLAARGATVHACTDITGFGLAGHAFGMARASSATLRFRASALPRLEGALEAVAAGHCPGGAKANEKYVGDALVTEGISDAERGLVVDPQTSGGLLLAIPAGEIDGLLGRMRERGVPAVVIGDVVAGPARIHVVP